jgi:hypothetical protein
MKSPKSEEDLEKLKLPPIPQQESKTEKTEKVEEPEIVGETKEEKPNQKSQQSGWTSENIETLLKIAKELLGTNLADKWITYKKTNADLRRQHFESVSTHNRRMIYALILFLIGVIGFMSSLTWFGKVSSDALLFLVGTVTGYIILSVQRLVFPSEEPPVEEQEK